MEYPVNFGSAFAVNGFGFIQQGRVKVDSEFITFIGKKSWPAWAKVGIFLLLTVVPFILFKIALGVILALVILHYFCASDGQSIIRRNTITDVRRKGRLITFKGKNPDNGKICKSVVVGLTDVVAEKLEFDLLGVGMPESR